MDTLRRYSWLVGLLGLCCFVGFFSLWFLNYPMAGLSQAVGIAAASLLVFYLFLDRDQVGGTVQSRAFMYGTGSSLTVVVVGAIAVLGFGLSERYEQRWDLTGRGRFTLSKEALDAVSALDAPVEVFAFFSRETAEDKSFRELMGGLQVKTDMLNVTFVDPLREPMLAEQFAITSSYGTVVLQRGDDRQRLESEFGEMAFVRALGQLTAGVEHTVCWSTGHGEADPDEDYEGRGFGVAVQKLEDRNYTVKKVRVLSEQVPADCEALVVTDGLIPWTPQELESVAAYVVGGGRVLWMIEPHFKAETQGELLNDLMRYGVVVGSDIVIEADPFHLISDEDLTTVLLYGNDLPDHPITSPMQGAVVLGMARSVSPLAIDGLGITVLANSSLQSWAETDLKTMPPQPDEGVDTLIGSVPLAIAVEIYDPSVVPIAGYVAPAGPETDPFAEPDELETLDSPPEATEDAPAAEDGDTDESVEADLAEGDAPSTRGELGSESLANVGKVRSKGVPADFVPKKGGRLVVIGDVDFASNQLVANGNNQDLFLNSVAWLVNDTAQLTERPPLEPDTLDISIFGVLLNWLISIFLVPGAAVAFAFFVVVRRRFM